MTTDRLMVMLAAVLSGLMILCVTVGISYQGRVRLWDSQVRGCERGKLDRRANAQAWAAARQARLQTARDPHVDPQVRHAAARAAEIYLTTIRSLRSRLDPPFDCDKAFPRPSVAPLL